MLGLGNKEIAKMAAEQTAIRQKLEQLRNEIVGAVCYPNPAANTLFFDLKGLNANGGLVEIFDAKGQLKLASEVSVDDKMILTLGSMMDGLYLYQIRDKAGKLVTRGKVVVQKN
jgi:hypothetical protein